VDPMRDLDEHLPAIALGDADAFERWVAGAEATVRTTLRSFAATVDTEAVLQEALLRVWQVAPRFLHDGRPNGLVRLAIRMARNLAVSEWRRMRTAGEMPLSDDEAFVAPLVAAPDPMLRSAILDCRNKLPDKPQKALDARLELGGTTPDEILATRLGMQKNTFLQNFTRARKLLADCLRAHGIDLEAELA
jgi:DNA-directed RNA polymerase specialized sigma24 family protein